MGHNALLILKQENGAVQIEFVKVGGEGFLYYVEGLGYQSFRDTGHEELFKLHDQMVRENFLHLKNISPEFRSGGLV